MKKIICTFMLLQALAAYSQKEGNIWYFGVNAGLDFNSGTPVALLDGELTSDEGTAAMADAQGNLLFYTNGMTVWNKNHQIMENGTGLEGMITSAQSALIVPKPGFGNTYYIFTVQYQAQGGLTYSEVDMAANNGLGRITAAKNVLLVPITTEQLIGVMHTNGNDVWVTTHGYPNNTFYSFLVTTQGVTTTPVTSNQGLVFTDESDTMGCMKISPDGTKIATANELSGAQLFDFDAATGLVSNSLQLTGQRPLYGVSFSPSGKVLYFTDIGDGGLLQYNLQANNIPASQLIFTDGAFSSNWGMQLAPDGKIYFVSPGDGLAAINNPDVVGAGCNWQHAAVLLGGRLPYLGMPNFIESTFLPKIYAEDFCLGSTTRFTAGPGAPPQAAQWNFGDGTTSQLGSPVHTYAAPGTYTVTVTALVMGSVRTLTKEITIFDTPRFSMGGPYAACTASDLQITPQATNFNPAQATWLWEFDGQVVGSAATLQPQDFGTYTLTVTVNGCSATRSIDVGQVTISAAFLEGCGDTGYALSVTPAEGSFDAATATYTWTGPEGFTGNTQQVAITEAGEYILTIETPGGCTLEHSWDVINAGCPDALIPKGISPNGDGKNDVFDLTLHKVAALHIFNRYGLEVFSQANYTTQWYGQSSKGDTLPDGTYFYSMQKDNGINVTGWVYVNRQNR